MNELTTTLQIPVSTLVELVFYVVVGIYAIFSAILYFHWQQYASNAKVTGLTLGIYLATTVPLIILMGVVVFIV
ncbi:MAG: hypothetical protein AAB388_01015 [Patescibacteria group bacterium]